PSGVTSPPCGEPPLSERRMVIDAIKDDGTHIVLENNKYSTISWSEGQGLWLFEIEADDGMNRVYFKWAKCVLAPVTA
ncbi:hypothetical protein PMAYCL1PPCAC_16053, partial [Pristionchus mayeri]